MIKKRLKKKISIKLSKRPAIASPRKFLFIACAIGTLFILAALTIKSWPLEFDSYYPRSSFRIPEDVLRERIATQSAQTVRIPIIMYHYVEYVDKEKDPGRFNLATSPYYLEQQIISLQKSGYTFLFVKQIPDLLVKPGAVPQKPIALTFDDGYEDFYWQALPILKKYQVRGTLYVITDFIGRSGYLNLKELEEIRDSGLVEIGAHTLNHAYLKDLRVDLARAEVFESKARLENLLGISVLSFAYPYGAFSKQTLQLTKAAGFTNAVSVIPGVNQSEDNLFYLFRLRPGFLPLPDPAKTLAAYK